MTVTDHLAVSVRIDGREAADVRFTLEVTVELGETSAVVSGGAIAAVVGDACTVTASLRLDAWPTPLWAPDPVSLPVRVTLTPPVRIPLVPVPRSPATTRSPAAASARAGRRSLGDMDDVDAALERAIDELLDRRAADSSICPSEAARAGRPGGLAGADAGGAGGRGPPGAGRESGSDAGRPDRGRGHRPGPVRVRRPR